MTKIATMEELFLDEIRDLYDAEKQLTKALPKMAEADHSDQLRTGFKAHLEQTKGHVQRLERIFEALGEKASGKKCAAMTGLIKEGDELAGNTQETAVRDAGLIAAAQKVEHYEIAGYGSAKTHAALGNRDAVRLLEQTLQEEKNTNEKLTHLAESSINSQAAAQSGTSPPKTSAAR